MSDFSDRPLVAGSLFGLRAFAIDGLGRLVGPSYSQVFTPGLNEAECRKSTWELGGMSMSAYYWSAFGDPFAATITSTPRRAKPKDIPKPELEPEVKHTPGILDCTCGFYAYFDGENDYKEPERVAAIIEGFGVCTLGDRGFRAEKARLVAIIEPGRKFPDRTRGLLHRNYGDVTFYASKREALDNHPLSQERVPSPASDPEFWTRGVK